MRSVDHPLLLLRVSALRDDERRLGSTRSLSGICRLLTVICFALDQYASTC